ncbi:innexin unc-9 [Clonorchis sinensis]|uniref:Innexin n=1 Tax=Clonorchis sinensis TaxID=79923 RepID=G7YIB3_CLOSI|nr:innexin unc-9 [Clonorchis sinensis]
MDTHFFAGLTKFKLDAGKFRRDDDFSDRFSHTFTPLLLVIFTLVISARQYIGKPIACWVPTEFTRAQEEYAESVCWVTSTYFIPTREVNVPVNLADREDRKIHYYQWVPFILMIQAFLFNLPCIVWRLFNWQSGIHNKKCAKPDTFADIPPASVAEKNTKGEQYVGKVKFSAADVTMKPSNVNLDLRGDTPDDKEVQLINPAVFVLDTE